MASMTELFLDNEFLEWTPGVTRELHRPVKYNLNPVLRPEKWWETHCILPNAVLYDKEEKLFKMWYRTGPAGKLTEAIDGHVSYTGYAISADGINWERPELGIFEIGGRRDHNIVLKSEVNARHGNVSAEQGKKAFILSVVPNPHPADENEKYVCMFADMGRRGCYLGYSKDGIHWRREPEPFWQTPVDVTRWGDDTLKSMIYDHLRQKWVIYRRVIPQESERLVARPGDENWRQPERITRIMAYADSRDLKKWENHRVIMIPDADDPGDTEFYGFSCYNYANAYVGYLWIYHTAPDNETIDIQLVTSRNGIDFTRCAGRSVYLPASPQGSFDRMICTSYMAEPMIVDDTVYIFYGGTNIDHGGSAMGQGKLQQAAGMATFKRDRFVNLYSSGNMPSYIVTKPFIVKHSDIYVNAGTWGGGSVKASVLTRDWRQVSGYECENFIPVSGNALDHPLIWKNKNGIAELKDREVRLRLHLDQARVHALTFDNAARPLGKLPDLPDYGGPRDCRPVDV